MKLSRFQTTRTNRRQGFTLIELLVVIGIITVLAGFLLPAVFSALRRSKEFVIQKNVTDLKGALEMFKNKYQVYPIDFSVDPALAGGDYVLYQQLVTNFVRRLSGRHQYGNAGFTIFAPNANLENPYPQFPNNKDTYGYGDVAVRHPGDMSAAEGFVFLLSGLSENAEYPLGYVDGGSGVWVIDPNISPKFFYEFKDEKLVDLDQDGWPEFVPNDGPAIPICYFDARTYTQLQRTVLVDSDSNGTVDELTELRQRLFALIQVTSADHGDASAGTCYPYLSFLESTRQGRFVFEGQDKYQLIAAGMDGIYGVENSPPFTRYSRNDDAQLNSSHRDNITSFSDTTLGNNFVTN